MMLRPINVLYLEDNDTDRELVQSTLEDYGLGIQLHHARNRPDLINILSKQEMDVVLSDYSLPDYDGFSALKDVRLLGLDCPFILISGTLGEEKAVEALQAGATDYILKDRLTRLGPSIERAIREKQEKADRESLELRLQQIQRIESIGRLAGGIAHDFNNKLGIILLSASSLLSRLSEKDPAAKEINNIRRAAEDSASLVRQLLIFSKRQNVEMALVDLNQLLLENKPMLKRLIGEDIHLVYELTESRLPIHASAGQIDQVIMNLSINAKDAMPKGGQIKIRTESLHLENEVVLSGQQISPGSYVCLSISDQGSGMDEKTLEHIFEPFFTTKPVDKGTGLGLSTVYGVVEQHRGVVTVNTALGQGTEFKIFFPRNEEGVEQHQVNQSKKDIQFRGQKILLVEDEELLGQTMMERLRESGLYVDVFTRPEAALRQVESGVEKYDVLLTDVVLPDMSGHELAGRIKRSQPSMKVIFMSGYIESDSIFESIQNDRAILLEKPVRLDVLLNTLSQCLNA